MNKKLLTALTCLTIAFASCDKVKDALVQDADIKPGSASFTIPVITNTSSISTVGEATVNINVDSLLKAQIPAANSSNVKSVKLKGFTLEISDADSVNNLGAFESISAELEAKDKSSEVLVSLTGNPDSKTASSVVLPVSGSGLELKGYIMDGSFKYKIKGKARRATTKPIKAKATAIYQFTVGL